MNSFSIAQLEQLSGIKAHTIRIWEKRYNAITPTRNKGNIRIYDSQQLKRLLNIVTLLDYHKISYLSSLSDDKLNKIIIELISVPNTDAKYYINQFIAISASFDEQRFNEIYTDIILKLGVLKSYTDVIYPLLQTVGILWSTDSLPIAQEHFISNMIRQKLYVALDNLPINNQPKQTWLLVQPESEFHDIGLLLAAYVIKSHQHKVIYIGANTPFSSIEQINNQVQFDHIFMLFVHNNNANDISQYFKNISKVTKNKPLYFSCSQMLSQNITKLKHIHYVQDIANLESLLMEMK